MDILEQILPYSSVSIIGMAKNSGKTVCLNHLLSGLGNTGRKVAVTSVGIDGEKTDLVTQTEKPEIALAEGVFFETSEYHYRQRMLTAEIMEVSGNATSLGRLVSARTLLSGKVILSGPSTSAGVRDFLAKMSDFGANMMIVDGALSRKSHASPLLTDGLVLSVGTSLAPDLNTIVRKASELHNLMQLPDFQASYSTELMQEENGVFALGSDTYRDLGIPSSLLSDKYKEKILSMGTTIFVAGILTDMLLNFLRTRPEVKDTVVVVKDFTKVFVTPMSLQLYLSKGGRLSVLKRPNLLAVTVNPVAPSGFRLESALLKESIGKVFGAPVFDVVSDRT